jgi:hypothetical protein
VGQWVTAPGGVDAGAVGQWLPTTKQDEGANSAPEPSPSAIGSWSVASPQQIASVKVSDRMTVADVVRQNPNISALRIVEFNPQSGVGGGFREVLNIATAAMRKHLGD